MNWGIVAKIGYCVPVMLAGLGNQRFLKYLSKPTDLEETHMSLTEEYFRTAGFVPTRRETLNLHNDLDISIYNEIPKNIIQEASGHVDNVTAVTGQLITSGGLSSDEKNMTAITALWVQHVTIGIAKQHGWTTAMLADPERVNSLEYWGYTLQAITQYTPWVVPYYRTYENYNKELHSGEINLAQIISTVIQVALGTEAAQKMSALAEIMQSTQNVGVENVATFFWNHKYEHHEQSKVSFSPIVRDTNGRCEMSFAYTFMSYTQEDWRSLFVQSHYEDFQLIVSSIGIKFYPSIWDMRKSTVENRMQPWLDNVNSAPLG